jgi:hypothetical protein
MSSVDAIARMPTLPMQDGQKLINTREKTPEKLDLQREARRENAGQRAVPTHETRRPAFQMVAGALFRRTPRVLRALRAAGRSLVPTQPRTGLPTQVSACRWSWPEKLYKNAGQPHISGWRRLRRGAG